MARTKKYQGLSAVAYCRVDTDKKDKAARSFAKKAKRILKYCLQKGITVVDFVNDQCSGTTTNRPGLSSICKRISTGELRVDFVCVSSLNALTRSSDHAIDLMNELALHGVKVLPVDEK